MKSRFVHPVGAPQRLALALALALTLTLALATAGCLPAEEPPPPPSSLGQRIINGTPCTGADHPSALAVIIEAKLNAGAYGTFPFRTLLCTGTLIAPDVVLIAAHCLSPDLLVGGAGGMVKVTEEKYFVSSTADLTAMAALDPAQILAGKLPDLPADAIPVSGRLANPGFSAALLAQTGSGLGNLYDSGLLFLGRAVTQIEPAIVIARGESTQLAKDKVVDIVGWGQQTAAGQNPLQPPPAGTVGLKVCGVSFINELGDHEMQVGAGPDTPRKCHGDSGGPSYATVETPASHKVRVVGITSHAYDQTDCAKGGVDTRVDAWFDWIDQELRRACQEQKRVWCEVPGVIPAEHYDPKLPEPAPDAARPEARPGEAAVAGTDGAVALPPAKGCGCSAPGERPERLGIVLLLSLLSLGLAVRARARRVRG